MSNKFENFLQLFFFPATFSIICLEAGGRMTEREEEEEEKGGNKRVREKCFTAAVNNQVNNFQKTLQLKATTAIEQNHQN